MAENVQMLLAVENAHELWPAASTDAHANVDALWEELRSAWESRGQGGIELVDALEAINDLLDRGVIQPEQFREMLVRARAHAGALAAAPAARTSGVSTKIRASKGGGTAAGRVGAGRAGRAGRGAGGGGGGAAGRGGARGRGSWQAVRSAVGGGGRSLLSVPSHSCTSLCSAAAARQSGLVRLAPLAMGAAARTPVQTKPACRPCRVPCVSPHRSATTAPQQQVVVVVER